MTENHNRTYRIRPKLAFILIQMCFWCSWAAFTSYATALFTASGMSATMIGIALAINTALTVAGQFFWGYVCDRLKTNKKVFMAVSLLIAFMYFALYYSASNVVTVVLFGVLGFIQLPMATIMDTWILKYHHDTPGDYGPIRAWGSFAYAIFVVLYGGMLERYGFFIMPYTGLALFILIILIASATPDVPGQSKEKEGEREKALKGEIFRLVTGARFIWFIVIVVMIALPGMQLQNALPIIMAEQDNAIFYMGVCLFATAMAEVPFMMMAKKMAHIQAYKRFIIAVSLVIISFAVILYNSSPLFLIISLTIYGASFGIMFPALRQATYEMSPEGLHNTTQGIVGSSSNVAEIAGNLIMGRTLDIGGTFLLVLVNMSLQIFTFCLLIIRTYILKPRSRS